MTMQPADDQGRALDADYLVEPDGRHLALTLGSRSGMSGSRPPRNPDYNRALTVLLARLGMLDAVLVDALVDSRDTQQLGAPEADRRLIKVPIRLAAEPDIDALRRRMGTAQARIAQAPDATKGGNSTQRIRLRLDVPVYGPADAARLGVVLAAPMGPSSAEGLGYWWERDPGENVFMEITRRDDIGANLQAPAAARGGGATASLWVPNTASPHATWAYSWIRPPSRSRRRTRILVPAMGGSWRPAGGFWCSVRCGRWVL